MVSRSGNLYADRMMNTEVGVYSTESGSETEVASCGKINGNLLFRRFVPKYYQDRI